MQRVVSDTKTPCYAWALLPNHFHLLLRSGESPISTMMRRLLTGYAIGFNRRHKRSGRLFQNRYKSILCQENRYFLELVRYIHLNPIRVGLVSNLNALDVFPFCGHCVLAGNSIAPWQDTVGVLSLFSQKTSVARQQYRLFINEGMSQGRRPELTGGGLLRSAGGWGVLKTLKRMKAHVKGDERILGDSAFVQAVLNQSKENYERSYQLKTRGHTIETIVRRASELFDVSVKAIITGGKQPDRVKARSLAAFWAVKELGMNGTAVGRKIGLTQSAVSRAVQRGEQLSEELAVSMEKKADI